MHCDQINYMLLYIHVNLLNKYIQLILRWRYVQRQLNYVKSILANLINTYTKPIQCAYLYVTPSYPYCNCLTMLLQPCLRHCPVCIANKIMPRGSGIDSSQDCSSVDCVLYDTLINISQLSGCHIKCDRAQLQWH